MPHVTVQAPGEAPTRESWKTRLPLFLNPIDGRYEDLRKGDWRLNVLRDFTAGLIVAMVAIPLAMGFAMASGLRPEQGIVGGAIAGLVGALFGGSKYQVYGPTAAYIPVIAGLMAKYDHGMLVLASLLAGVVLMAMGLKGLGKMVEKVPHSIVVGFTIGIAVVIAMSQLGEVLGLPIKLGHHFGEKVQAIATHLHQVNVVAILLGLGTFLGTKLLLRVSPFIPAPLIAIGVATGLASTVFAGSGLMLVRDRYGSIPADMLVFTAPGPIPMTAPVLYDLVYFVLAIVFVAAVESLLCSRMADRLAGNQGQPFNPNKELWGQGLVNIFVPLMNGFPHTGALARTATNIKLGAISPLAGVFKFALKLLLAAFLAKQLEAVPMACIGGILLFVAFGMVKPAEVTEVWEDSRLHKFLMIYTAIAVVVTDFMVGVMSALVLYALLSRFVSRRAMLPAA